MYLIPRPREFENRAGAFCLHYRSRIVLSPAVRENGIIFAGIGMGLSWLLHGCPFGQSIDALLMFSTGISISLFAGAIFFPLFYLGGEERTGVFLVISLLCAIGITMAISTFINIALISEMTIWKIILKAAVMLACSLLALALSYPLTVAIFRRKEY